MEHGDAAVELGLHRWSQEVGKVTLPSSVVLLADCAVCERGSDQAGGKQGLSHFCIHRGSPLSSAGTVLQV